MIAVITGDTLTANRIIFVCTRENAVVEGTASSPDKKCTTSLKEKACGIHNGMFLFHGLKDWDFYFHSFITS